MAVIWDIYPDQQQLCRVKSVADNGTFTGEWMVGAHSKNWTWWKKRGVTVTDELPLSAILKRRIILTAASRLPAALVQELKNLYLNL